MEGCIGGTTGGRDGGMYRRDDRREGCIGGTTGGRDGGMYRRDDRREGEGDVGGRGECI